MSLFSNILHNIGLRACKRWLAGVRATMPAHALHWYVVLLLGAVGAGAVIILSWFIVPQQVHTEAVTTETEVGIEREQLEEALKTQAAREESFQKLQATPPRVVDPGR